MASKDDKFSLARFCAMNAWPYYSAALMGICPVPVPGFKNMAIDRFCRVYFDPEMIGTGSTRPKFEDGTVGWTPAEAGTLVLHEIEHWLRKHFERAGSLVTSSQFPALTARLVNLCQDCEINDDLRDAGLDMWVDHEPLSPRDYEWQDGELWEEYHAAMRREIGDVEERIVQKLRQARQRVGDDVSLVTQEDLGKFGKCLVLDCGSAAHGLPQGYELPPVETDQFHAVGHAEAELIRDQVARAALQTNANRPGTVPGGVLRWAKNRLRPPQVPWERELAALIRAAVTMARGCSDYSYQMPSRRGNFAGVIMPALVQPKVQAAVVVDTSASMEEDTDLPAVLSEIEGIIRACGQQRVAVYCCDAAVAPSQEVSRAFEIKLTGGGGTNMCVGIDAARRDGHKVIVVLTDGYTPWPSARPPACEIVAGLVGDSASRAQALAGVPGYMTRVVEIRTEQKEADQ
jgi:predicted metal-dependent peptidase